ncbi:Mnd1 [Giardia muris]|uniref:Mnd1 n=1 Tax=Giardia muris TaxID=5742 RepID=A0A4Z1T4A6_GIAMU|nr:Mnd1 [Giardia muris]|eukprot:TNJ27251.1 Mnd1 [Giardia muris]
MAPKGTSLDEKKAKLLDQMLQTGEIYSNKTIEALSKPTGISAMIIKQVLMELVNEDLVDSEKIGTSTYYWCFASKKSQTVLSQKSKLEGEIQQLKKEIQTLEKSIVDLQGGREESDQRTLLLQRQAELQATLKEQKERFKQLSKNDPEVANRLKSFTKTAIEQANIWTDNILSLKKHLVEKYGMDPKELGNHLGITVDFDYL